MSKTNRDRPRLGRGLSSLIPVVDIDVSTAAEVSDQSYTTPVETVLPPSHSEPVKPPAVVPVIPGAAYQIPLSLITVNPHQPRKQFSEQSLAELAASLKSTGMIQPLVVRIIDGAYQLIAGERRWRAAALAGLATVPVIVREADSYTQAQMALVENIQREDLNPLDRAMAYRTLMTQLGVTQAELAGRMGEDRSSIANHLRLLELTDPVQSRIAEGLLSLGHAKVLAAVIDPAEQERLADLCVNQGLSVRNLERILAAGTPQATKTPKSIGSPHVQDVEKAIARQLGMRVQLKAGNQGQGKLSIHYASLDQFDELVQRLGINLE